MGTEKVTEIIPDKFFPKRGSPPSNCYENYDSQLSEWSQELREFKLKLKKVSDDIRAEAAQKIEDLEAKYMLVIEKMHELKNLGLIPKDETKISFENAWKDLLLAYEAAKKSFH